jgi:hypothetical protein
VRRGGGAAAARRRRRARARGGGGGGRRAPPAAAPRGAELYLEEMRGSVQRSGGGSSGSSTRGNRSKGLPRSAGAYGLGVAGQAMLIGRNPSRARQPPPPADRLHAERVPAPRPPEPTVAGTELEPAPKPLPTPEMAAKLPPAELTPPPSPRLLLALHRGPGFLVSAAPCWAEVGGRDRGVALRIGYCRLALAAAFHGRLGQDTLLPLEEGLARRISTYATERVCALVVRALEELKGNAAVIVDRVLPMYSKGMEEIRNLNMLELAEFRDLTKPPPSILPVYHAICILMGWGSGGGKDGIGWFHSFKKLAPSINSQFVDMMLDYDKDAITEQMFRSQRLPHTLPPTVQIDGVSSVPECSLFSVTSAGS